MDRTTRQGRAAARWATGAGAAVLALLAFAGVTQAGAIVDNGVVELGVRDQGHLVVCCGTPSDGTGTEHVGMRYLPTNHEVVAPACHCEGWGASYNGVTSGSANEGQGGVAGMSLVSFTSTADSAVSVVRIGALEVTHGYHPSNDPNLYEVTVTLENTDAATLRDVRYRRVVDWDVEPTAFSDYVTLSGGTPTASALLFSSDHGFLKADPLAARGSLKVTGPPSGADFVDNGPDDHGAMFDFGFGDLAPGKARVFQMYLGAAGNEDDAEASLTAVGAEVYTLGQPSNEGGPDLGEPNTFIQAFAGVGGTPPLPLPVTTLSFSGTAGEDDWYRSDGDASLACTVAGGACTATRYSLDDGAWTDYTGPFPVSGEGTHEVRAYSTSDLGTVESTRTFDIGIDTTPPTASANAACAAPGDADWCRGPVEVTTTSSDALSGVSTEACDVDGAAASCGSASIATQGSQTFTILVTDKAGNTASDAAGFQVDSVAPDASIALDCPAPGDGGWCRASSADYDTSATDATSGVASTSCTLDGEPAACSGTVSGEGAHTIAITARDAAGNEASRSLEVHLDSEPPTLTVTSDCAVPGDAGWCRGAVTLHASASDTTSGAASVTCTLDGALSACDVTEAGQGAHTFTATATDAAGNEASATESFDIDSVAPEATLTTACDLQGNAPWCRSPSYTYTTTSSDATSGIASARCTLDGAAVACDGTVGGEGAHTLSIMVRDVAGNEASATSDLGIDSIAPAVSLTTACDLPGNAPWCRSPSAAYTGAAEDATSGVASLRCEADGATADCDGTVSTQGLHSLTATAEDEAGNQASATVDIGIDSEAPALSLATDCAAPWCRSPSYAYASEAGDVTSGLASLSCTLDGAAANCSGTVASEGMHSLTATATDVAGNEAAASQDLGIDSVAPAPRIATDCADPGNIPWCRSPSYTYTMDASDATSGVASQTCTLDGAAADCAGTVEGEGMHALRIDTRDAAGNEASASLELGIDTGAPVLALAQECALPGNAGWCRDTVHATATATDPTSDLATLTCALDGAAAACDLEVASQGEHTFAATATDAAGNAASGSIAFRIDSVAPDAELLRPDYGSVFLFGQRVHASSTVNGVPVGYPGVLVVGDMTVVVRAEDATSGLALAALHIDGAPRTLDASPVAGFFHMDWEAGDEALGDHAFEVRTEDQAGNADVDLLTVTTVPTNADGLAATLAGLGVPTPEEAAEQATEGAQGLGRQVADAVDQGALSVSDRIAEAARLLQDVDRGLFDRVMAILRALQAYEERRTAELLEYERDVLEPLPGLTQGVGDAMPMDPDVTPAELADMVVGYVRDVAEATGRFADAAADDKLRTAEQVARDAST